MIRAVTGRLHKEIAARSARKLARRALPGPLVSFTFDDFPRSALDVAGRILLDRGLRGTYYVAAGLMGRTTEVGEICGNSDLEALVAAGHELACHGRDHRSCYGLSGSEVRKGCEDNRAFVAELLKGYQLRNYAYPYGEVTLAAKSALTQQYQTCRGTGRGLNADFVDLALLRATPAYSSRPIGALKQLIEEAVRRHAWLVLYTHDVRPNPSPHGCTPDYFTELLSTAVDSGADVVTVADAAQRFQLAG